MTTKLTPEALAAAVLETALAATAAGHVDAAYLQKHFFPELSLSTVQRVATAANDAGLIINRAYHGARRDWVPSRGALLEEIRQLRAAAEQPLLEEA